MHLKGCVGVGSEGFEYTRKGHIVQRIQLALLARTIITANNELFCALKT